MKSVIKLAGLIAVAALIGLSFTACGDPVEEEKTLVITDLPGDWISKYGYVGLIDSKGNIVSICLPKRISGSSLSLDLLDNKGKDRFTGSGRFSITLIVTNTSNPEDIYYGGVTMKSISEATTKISYDDFMDISDFD